jgi:hypothetical protein
VAQSAALYKLSFQSVLCLEYMCDTSYWWKTKYEMYDSNCQLQKDENFIFELCSFDWIRFFILLMCLNIPNREGFFVCWECKLTIHRIIQFHSVSIFHFPQFALKVIDPNLDFPICIFLFFYQIFEPKFLYDTLFVG